MIYVIIPSDPLPANVAKALSEYYARHGNPPPPFVSAEVDGEVVEVKEFETKEE
jgi:hypothetical protein